MPIFYFHLKQGDNLVLDEEGQDFLNVSDAEAEGIRSARDILSSAVKAGKALVTDALVIANEQGHPVATVPISVALPKQFRER